MISRNSTQGINKAHNWHTGYFLISNPSFVSCLQELEQIEEHYKQETRDLLSTVKRLQDENRKLASSLAAATERDSAFSEDGKF